ncbi:MAG TPA: hypothetical protein PLQ80_10755 [Candidatus Syntrophosphaera sp.]|nr:hypothetical protein [Candidatus Syntrophosphaera sp.]HPH60982.1 hypothetical protein [Candidatus Syntrophosphaera sp.]
MSYAIDWLAVGSIAACVQAVAFTLGFVFTYKQLKQQTRAAKARSMMSLKEMFDSYKVVATSLRQGGKWEHEIPDDAESWGLIDRYLGVFEYCGNLLATKMVDASYIERAYKAKLLDAIHNASVEKKLKNDRDSWKELISLCERLDVDFPQ